MDFEQKKAHILREIAQNDGHDQSPKGSIDVLCWPLIALVNAHRELVTTSSCSGRVSVFVEGSKQGSTQIGAKGNGGHWLFVTHEKSQLQDWWAGDKFPMAEAETLAGNGGVPELGPHTRYVLFKFEPVIFHVKCQNAHIAARLYSTAMGCGFRESGIGSNNNVAIRTSLSLDVPIGVYNEADGRVVPLVDANYIRILTKLAHDRFLENERKTQLLYDKINTEIVLAKPAEKAHVETKEERKARKIQEGMARRDEVLKQKAEKRRLAAAAAEANAEANGDAQHTQ